MKIAITGGIGSGKSYVCRILEKQGIKVYDCDAEAKRLMRYPDSIIHDFESAILFDSGFDRRTHFDFVVCVTAPVPVRLKRIMLRDHISEQKAQEWIDAVMPQEELAARADFEIVNDGIRDVEEQVMQLLKRLA